MNSIGASLNRILSISTTTAKLRPALGNGELVLQGSSQLFYSTGSDNDSENDNDVTVDEDDFMAEKPALKVQSVNDVTFDEDDFMAEKPALKVQSVDPKRGWNYRGVHKAILCGKIGQAPIQKMLRNGHSVTIFTVGTGGMFDQRSSDDKNLPKPAQWHRIAVHNELLGAYSVRQLVKNSSVYIEGDLETRVYNDSINGAIKTIPEICVRRDGKIRLIKSGESISNLDMDEFKKGLLSVPDLS